MVSLLARAKSKKKFLFFLWVLYGSKGRYTNKIM